MIKIGNLKGAGIYKISHPDSHRFYIGSSISLEERADNHENLIKNDKHHSKNLKIFAKKVDKSLFTFTVIDNFENCLEIEKLLTIKEQWYLDNWLKANENNADFFRLGLNSSRIASRSCGSGFEKPILQYDLEGNFIQEWRSATFAAKTLNIAPTSITSNLSPIKYKYLSAGRFQWKRFEENYPLKINKFELPHVKKVLKYTLDGIFVKEYAAIRQAAIANKVNCAGIASSCDNFGICGKFIYRWFTENFPKKISVYKNKKHREIYIYKKNGEFIKKALTFKEAATITKSNSNTISQTINNPSKRAKFVFSSTSLQINYFLRFAPKIKSITRNKRKIIQYSLSGNFIKIWDSLTQVKKLINISVRNESINNNYAESGNYLWKSWDSDFKLKIPPYIKENRQKIYCYNSNGIFIKEFVSIFEAGNQLNIPHGNIVHHLKGRIKICYGYYFSTEPKIFENYLRNHKFQKKIKITNLITGEITQFGGKREASKILNLHRSAMTTAIKENNGIMIKKQLKIEEI